MMMMNLNELVLPLESAEFVMKNAKSVQLNQNGIGMLSRKIYECLKNKNSNYFNWKAAPLNPKKMNEFAINWIFLVDSLNFSFWSDNELNKNNAVSNIEKYKVIYNNVSYHGYWALCAAINRALDEGYPITEANYYAFINEQEFRHIFRSDSSVQIPLVENRIKVLHETGKVLIEEFQGSFLNCIKLANGSAKYLLKLIVDFFPSYRDETIFLERKVTFYKRAQILIADVWGCFEGQGYGYFSDIDVITMFADYRVPQVLKYYDAIDYSDELKEFLQKNIIMTSGSQYEVEIRAASILACHQIALLIKKQIGEESPILVNGILMPKAIINDILVDFYLWNYRVDNSSEIDSNSIPFHKIRCIFY